MLSAELTLNLIATDHYYTSTLTKVNAALLLGIDPMWIEKITPMILNNQVEIEVKLYSELSSEMCVSQYIALNEFVTPKAKKLFNSRKAVKLRYKTNLREDAQIHRCYTKFLEYVQSNGIDLDNLNFESHANLRMVILNKLAA